MAGKLCVMAHITVPDESTVTNYTVTSAQSVFSVPWTCFDKTDIQVLVGASLLLQSDFSFAGNPGTEGGFDGATITLVAAVSNTTVTIYRDIIVKRTDDFGVGPVSSRDRNTALDRVTAMIQDVKRIAKGVAPTVPLLPDVIQTVSNIVALRAVSWPSGRPTQISLVSNSATGDGGSNWRWDAASTATDDGKNVVKETAVTTGRWLRQWPRIQVGQDSCIPTILDYEGTGDGTADDRPALLSALSQNRGVFIPWCKADGTEAVWRINGEVTVGSDKAIIGDVRRPMVRQAAASKLFVLDGSRITIQNLNLDQVGQTSTAHASFHANTAVRSEIKTIRINNIRAGHSRSEAGIAALPGFRTFDDDASTGQMIDWQIEDVTIWGAKAAPIFLRDAWAAFFMDKVVVDFTRQVTAPSYSAFDIDGGEGLNLSFCNVQGIGTSGTGNAAGHGYSISNGAAVDMQDCRADTVGGVGFLLTSLNGSRIRGLVGSLCGEGQIRATSCINLGLDEVYAGGRNGLGWAPAAKPGLQLVSCGRARVTGLRAINSTGSGVLLTNSSSCQIVSFDAASNGAYGIDEAGTSDFNILSGGTFVSNTTSNGRTVGAGTRRLGLILNSGASGDGTGAGTW
jgi:hypothetical protein